MPSAVTRTSNSRASAPAATACASDSIVFSGACARFPRCPITGWASGARRMFIGEKITGRHRAAPPRSFDKLLERHLQPRDDQAADFTSQRELAVYLVQDVGAVDRDQCTVQEARSIRDACIHERVGVNRTTDERQCVE